MKDFDTWLLPKLASLQFHSSSKSKPLIIDCLMGKHVCISPVPPKKQCPYNSILWFCDSNSLEHILMRSYEHCSQGSCESKRWPNKEKSIVIKQEWFCWTLTNYQGNLIKTGLPPWRYSIWILMNRLSNK